MELNYLLIFLGDSYNENDRVLQCAFFEDEKELMDFVRRNKSNITVIEAIEIINHRHIKI